MAATRRQPIGATMMLTLAAAVMFHAGCERRDENAAKIQAEMNAAKTAQTAPAAATRPSTQQLLEGPTRRIALVVVPLTAEVPESWQVKTLDVSDSVGPSSSTPPPGDASTPGSPQQSPRASSGGLSLTELTGPAPSADVHVQLAQRMPWTAERLERMLKAAQRDADAQRKNAATMASQGAGTLMKFDIRQQDGMRVMEQQKVLVQPDGGARLLDWRLTFFAPRGGAGAGAGAGAGGAGAGGAGAGNAGAASVAGATNEFDACELNFLGLTVDQYEHDRAFLQKIVDSVRYDASGLTAAPGTSIDPLTAPPGR